MLLTVMCKSLPPHSNMKEKFYKVFANLPIPERSSPIYVSKEHGPMSWNVVKLEVDHETVLGIEALAVLVEMEII